MLWSHLGFEANVGAVDGWAALATSVVVAAACPGPAKTRIAHPTCILPTCIPHPKETIG